MFVCTLLRHINFDLRLRSGVKWPHGGKGVWEIVLVPPPRLRECVRIKKNSDPNLKLILNNYDYY